MRQFLYAIILSLAATPVFAVEVTTAWVQQLTLEGYRDIEIGRTWLGRTRIVAEKGRIEREIILNTETGEVLRDYSRHEDGSPSLPFEYEGEPDDHEGRGNGDDNGGEEGDPDDD